MSIYISAEIFVGAPILSITTRSQVAPSACNECSGAMADSEAAIGSSNQPHTFGDSASGGAPLPVSPAGLTLVS